MPTLERDGQLGTALRFIIPAGLFLGPVGLVLMLLGYLYGNDVPLVRAFLIPREFMRHNIFAKFSVLPQRV